MGRFTADQADNYGGQGGAGYFSLRNDKDVATVRFMYRGMDDVEGFAVHEVEVDGRKRYVNCLREYNDPLDVCPFCASRIPQAAKLFIPLYNVDTQRTQIWDRGKKFFAKISSICARYANGQELVSQQFEIERNGKAGETSTTYEIYPVGQPDNTTLEDLPEIPDILGSVILDKTAEEMEAYLQDGFFPVNMAQGAAQEMPVRRRTNNDNDVPFRERRQEAPARDTGRRTPASGRGRNNSDKF